MLRTVNGEPVTGVRAPTGATANIEIEDFEGAVALRLTRSSCVALPAFALARYRRAVVAAWIAAVNARIRSA